MEERIEKLEKEMSELTVKLDELLDLNKQILDEMHSKPAMFRKGFLERLRDVEHEIRGIKNANMYQLGKTAVYMSIGAVLFWVIEWSLSNWDKLEGWFKK
jgi:hypothetical protein